MTINVKKELQVNPKGLFRVAELTVASLYDLPFENSRVRVRGCSHVQWARLGRYEIDSKSKATLVWTFACKQRSI